MKKIGLSALLTALLVSSAYPADTVATMKQRLAQSSIACGIAPIPPVGCRVGACVCNQNRTNCQWSFVCN